MGLSNTIGRLAFLGFNAWLAVAVFFALPIILLGCVVFFAIVFLGIILALAAFRCFVAGTGTVGFATG